MLCTSVTDLGGIYNGNGPATIHVIPHKNKRSALNTVC